ncbi:hypothetical protein MPSEU_000920800 [Mayamaea pseudoterrestris]|nr:hypothetical protein MPSEU_000920800 [Mayamaea pseudoterrestris]
MTIPSDARCNYCPSCEEECNDHPSICTVCGSNLQYPESNERRRLRQQITSSSNVQTLLASLDALRHNTTLLSQNHDADVQRLRHRLEALTERLAATREQGNLLRQQVAAATAVDIGQGVDEWETVPAALLDPHAAGLQTSSSRPTSKEYLENMTKISLTKNSSLFYQASVSIVIDGKTVSFDAIPADFGGFKDANKHENDSSSSITYETSNTCLVMADPKTGKGGRLSEETLQQVQTATQANTTVVLYMERGDNVSFLAKARLAQQAGAKVCVIGNNQSTPWPYVMKNSAGSTNDNHEQVTIPVVMIKQVDGQAIVKACMKQQQQQQQQHVLRNVSFAMERTDIHECIICQEPYEQDGSFAIRIPACGHLFHETCGMLWLMHHNTCPFCRRELPTDDADYEQERRRQQRTHAGSQGQVNTQYEDFYG